MTKYMTVEFEVPNDDLRSTTATYQGIAEALRPWLGEVKINRIMDSDSATAHQIQEYKDRVKDTYPHVFIGEPNPDTGNRYADVLCILEQALMRRIVDIIDEYWEHQADGGDVRENVDSLKDKVVGLPGTKEFQELRSFTLTFERHLNAGGG